MTYITSIGLDVHARSVSACAFDPFTGEVAQRRFGTDAGEIAEWILGFESPKAVYESGPTGFALCREGYTNWFNGKPVRTEVAAAESGKE